MSSNHKDSGGNAVRIEEDVHRLRGIKLKGIQRDPIWFLGDCKVDPAHLEECFDADTLFYDVFFEPTNRQLVAVGPPLGNLKIELKIFVNGEPIKHRVIRRAAKRSYLVIGDVNRVETLNEVLVRANGHQQHLRVPENSTGTEHKFTLYTIQKDNRERWIRDWIEHYRKMGVDRVILYDNNSKKLPEVDAIVIPCPYKYGLDAHITVYGQKTDKTHFLKDGLKKPASHGRWTHNTAFLQRNLVTICGYKYRSGQLLHFDIDELLQVKSLEKYGKRKLVYFDSCFVETITDGKLPEDYSFRHFVYRNAHKRRSNYKFIVRMDALLYARSPHVAVLKNPIPRKFRFWLGLDEEAFYHYKGINTGWKLDRSAFDETAEVVKLEDTKA